MEEIVQSCHHDYAESMSVLEVNTDIVVARGKVIYHGKTNIVGVKKTPAQSMFYKASFAEWHAMWTTSLESDWRLFADIC